MNLLVLVFTILTIVKLQKSAEVAALDVLLPVMLLVPSIFALHIPHLPPLFCVDAVLLPLGLGALAVRSNRWRFKRADVWILIFVMASLYTDIINIGLQTALFNFPSFVSETLFAYVIGKLLIEQSGIRERFSRRLVWLLGAVALVCPIEFVLKRNLFLMIGRRFFTSAFDWAGQVRNGFLRIRGPFAGAEAAGIVFMLGFFFALWMWYSTKKRGLMEPKYVGMRRSLLLMVAVFLGMYMTLSRGPLLGLAAGFLVARIGMVKKKGTAIILALVLGVVGAIGAQLKARQYASLTDGDESVSETASSAYYRTQLYRVYKPVAEAGGLFGWSTTAYPRDPRFDSIDNEYLLLWVTQGKIGLTMFILIAAEGVLGIFFAIRRSKQQIDTCFYYCMGGALVALLIVLSTVFLISQGYVLFFLMVGWSQSLQDQFVDAEVSSTSVESRYNFKRVFA